MTSLEVSIKDAVLPVALANAAFLIAAPSLGCLTTYARVLNDLCQVYSLPSPDLTKALQYNQENILPFSIFSKRPVELRNNELREESQALDNTQSSTKTIAISSSTSVNYDECQEVTLRTKDTAEPVCNIKERSEEPMLKRIKQEVDNYTQMYKVCRVPPKTKLDNLGIQPANLKIQIRNNFNYFNNDDSEKPKVEPADNNDPDKTEIQPEILDDAEQAIVHPLNQNTAVVSANQNDKVRARVQPLKHNIPGQSGIQSAISQLSAEQQPSNVANVMEALNEKQSVPSTTHNDKTPAQQKCHKLYSYLLPDGTLIEEADKIYHAIMPIKYLGHNEKPKEAVLKVITFVKGSQKTPWIYISNWKRSDLQINFEDIKNIYSDGNDGIAIHYKTSFKVHRIQCKASIYANGKVRNAEENKKALLEWLHSFLDKQLDTWNIFW